MERNVYISIKGMHSAERDDDYGEVEVVAQGKYYERNGKYYISYEESRQNDGKAGRATVKVDEDSVIVNQPGSFGASLCFEQGKRTTLFYHTPFGVLEMGVLTKSLEMDLKEHNWKIHISYFLDINKHYMGEHYVHILVQDREGEPQIRLI